MAAHKIRGPKGIGAIAWRRGVRLTPVTAGGGQERGLRAGTLDAAAAAGLAVAIPAVVAYNLLHSRVDDFVGDMENAASETLDLLAAPRA